MASTAISAQGTTVQVDTSTEGTPDTEIKNIASFSGFDGEASEIDVTNLSSEAKEFQLGLVDNGGFNMEIHVDDDDPGQTALHDAVVNGTKKTFLMTLPNGKTRQFKGLVKNSGSMTGGIDAVLSGSVSVKITGPVTRGTES